MAASSTLQSAVVEKVVVRLFEQLAAKQQMAQPATRPPLSWRLATISETFPGSGGHTRVVTVKTTSGQFK